jgi:hypothetical protein
MKSLYKAAIIIPIVTMLIAPVIIGAQTLPTEAPPIQDLAGVESLLQKVLGWLNTFFYIAASIFVLIAAFQYLTAQGNEDKIKTAKNMLIYAVIAIAVALFAGGLDILIRNVITP